MTTNQGDWPSSLSDEELGELDRYLREHAHEGDGHLLLDGVHGMLSLLAVGPLEVLPDEWLPEVLHEPFGDAAEGSRVLALLAKLNDSIGAELDVDAYEPILGEIDTEHGPQLSAAGWCEGFSRGIDLRANLWETRLANDPTLMDALSPVMALAVDEGVLHTDAEIARLSDDEYEDCLAQVSGVLDAVGRYWQDHPATEAEIEAMVQSGDPEGVPPPRHHGEHWVH